jgi:hypothetical protein
MATPIEQLIKIRDGYLQALVQDSLNPIPDSTVDGVTIHPTEWRKELMDKISQINLLICAFDPVQRTSVMM